MFVTMLESSTERINAGLQKLAAIPAVAGRAGGESLPGPRYLELRSVPRDELAIAAFGAKPNEIATSWTDWMKSSAMMVTRKLDPDAIVLGTAMPLMLAEVRAVNKGRGPARKFWGRMVDGVERMLED